MDDSKQESHFCDGSQFHSHPRGGVLLPGLRKPKTLSEPPLKPVMQNASESWLFSERWVGRSIPARRQRVTTKALDTSARVIAVERPLLAGSIRCFGVGSMICYLKDITQRLRKRRAYRSGCYLPAGST